MSNDSNKPFTSFADLKYLENYNLQKNISEDIYLNTPQKDGFSLFRLQNSNFNNQMMSASKSGNKFPSFNSKKNEEYFNPNMLFQNFKNSNSDFDEEKLKSILLKPINDINDSNNYPKKTKIFLGKKKRFSKIKKIYPENYLEENDLEKIKINQIKIHGYKLLNFPLINKDLENFEVALSKKLIEKITTQYTYIKIVNFEEINDNEIKKLTYKIENNLPTIDIDELRDKNIDYYKNEVNVSTIINSYYNDITKALKKIQNYFTKNSKKIYFTKNILLIELLIRNCNLFTNYIITKLSTQNNIITNKILYSPSKKANSVQKISINNNNPNANANTAPKFILHNNNNSSELNIKNNNPINKINSKNEIVNKPTSNLFVCNQKNLFTSKVQVDNKFKCDFCDRVFKNGQALGGHISQSHPNKSDKYKQKIEIRNSRSDRREILYNTRRKLFKKYNIDLDYLIKNKRKNAIKAFIRAHKIQYKKELMRYKITNGCNNNSNSEK